MLTKSFFLPKISFQGRHEEVDAEWFLREDSRVHLQDPTIGCPF